MNTVTTGLSEGDFHRLAVLHNGDMTDIISLIGSLSGSGAIQSATAPLAIAAGVLTVDLSSYTTAAAVNGLLANYRLTASLFNDGWGRTCRSGREWHPEPWAHGH